MSASPATLTPAPYFPGTPFVFSLCSPPPSPGYSFAISQADFSTGSAAYVPSLIWGPSRLEDRLATWLDFTRPVRMVKGANPGSSLVAWNSSSPFL